MSVIRIEGRLRIDVHGAREGERPTEYNINNLDGNFNIIDIRHTNSSEQVHGLVRTLMVRRIRAELSQIPRATVNAKIKKLREKSRKELKTINLC